VVHLVKKNIKSNVYLYLEHREWVNGKSIRAWSIYLGPENRIIQQANEAKEKIDLFNVDWQIEIHDFGLPTVLMNLMSRLDLINIVDKATSKRDQGLSVGQYLAISVLNRCIQPCSKQQLRNWFQSSYLQKFFPPIDTYLDSMAYVNHFEYLDDKAIGTIESQLNRKLLDEFNVRMDQVMFDPTNYYTYIMPKNDSQMLPRHGHSKENRMALNIVGISLFCSSDYGIPIMHKVYPGNIRDVTQFKTEFPRFTDRLSDLEVPTEKVFLVFDKGNISEDVFDQIKTSNINWICSVRPSTQKDLQDLIDTDFESGMVTFTNGSSVGILEFDRDLHGNKGRLIAVHNANTQKRSEINLRAKVDGKIREIKSWFIEPHQFKKVKRSRLNYKKWLERDNVIGKVESMIGSKKFRNLIEYEVTGNVSELKLKFWKDEDAIKEAVRRLGKSFIMTNNKALSGKEIVWMYLQQYTIENSFKYLKNPHTLSVRPMYHFKDISIRGHVLSCIIGLMLLRLLTREVNTVFNLEISQQRILERLKEIQIARATFENRREFKETVVKHSRGAHTLFKKFKLDVILKN